MGGGGGATGGVILSLLSCMFTTGLGKQDVQSSGSIGAWKSYTYRGTRSGIRKGKHPVSMYEGVVSFLVEEPTLYIESVLIWEDSMWVMGCPWHTYI